MAEMLGDFSELYFLGPEAKSRKRDDGWTWVGIVFSGVRRGDEVWRWPNLDCHITLLYTQDRLGMLPKRLAELAPLLGRWGERCWRGFGKVNRQFAQPDYAWIDLQVTSAIHQTLHQCTHVLTQDDQHPRRNVARASFHVSFRTPFRREEAAGPPTRLAQEVEVVE